MKEISIKENVIFQVVILFQFIHQIKPIKYMTKKFGGVINGMLLIMEKSLILTKVFLNNLIVWWKMSLLFQQWIVIA